LVNSKPGLEGGILQSLREIEGVKEAYSLYGLYDVVAKVEANSMDELKDIVTFKVRGLGIVRATLTIIVVE